MPSPIPGSEGGRLDNGSFSSSSSFSSEYSSHLIIYTPIIERPPLQPFPTRGFPVEILDEILSYITDYHVIRRVLRVSRQFHELMLPKLWKNIHLRPQVGGQLLGTLTAQLAAPCSAWRTRGQHVQTLLLALECAATPPRYHIPQRDVREAYLPAQRFLAGLSNMHTLVLEANVPVIFATRARWRTGDIEMRQQLVGLKKLVFAPPTIHVQSRLGNYNTHPNTQFEQWLLSQENIQYFEYCTRHRLAGAFPAHALPNLRYLKIAAENIEAVARVFAELPALEELEAMRDDRTCIRFAPDGSSRCVWWKRRSDYGGSLPGVGVEDASSWCQDWEAGVERVYPASVLFFDSVCRMPPELQDLEMPESEEE
ncbi:hypothetical protein EYR38_008301 [Pleurotus pulmonarius]|nr:hypothetical protein EYR38_008301 [Pleurotus pulmonarius]